MARSIEVVGARENNLRNVRVEIPRDQLVVVTGVSGSGKSSLAFDTVYAEGQRRLLASMSSFAKRFIQQLKKPDVDFVNGLSPVISIDQKSVGTNPRSTVGTMTDVNDYMRMLYATMGTPHCPLCGNAVAVRSPQQILERLLARPPGTRVEVRAPVFRPHGEDHAYLFDQIRTFGYRRARIDGREQDLGAEFEVDEDAAHHVEAIVDLFVIEPGIDKQVLASLEHGAKLGNGFLSFHGPTGSPFPEACQAHAILSTTLHHFDFTFNDPAGACPTCAGLGTSKAVHVRLLVPDRKRTLASGAIVKEAFNNDRNTWGGRWLHSLSLRYRFSLDTPFEELPKKVVDILFHGTKGEKIEIQLPPGARQGENYAGKMMPFRGVITQLEHSYHWYRKQGQSNATTEEWLKKVMVDVPCPECGGARLKKARQLVRINGKNIHEAGELHLVDLVTFLEAVKRPRGAQVVFDTILREIRTRLDLLIEIGLDYLNLNRASGTLSGGESQRIRLSSQIGSGLMGMLYVLDEPSIGLHPKDNDRMIATLKRLRDLGNTVIVVEHDEDTIRAADHMIEIGPGPGVHGGTIVASGALDQVLASPQCLTAKYLKGEAAIAVPAKRRTSTGALTVRGARHNNLRNLDVSIPLGVLTCVTGASGSGKSSLVHEILYKQLYSLLHDSRVMAGDHDRIDGTEKVTDIIHIDQTPIGRTPRSNPATYVGFYDNIRKFFADSPQAVKRGFDASRFSFNVKGGRCEECAGDGRIVTQLSFMPDIEVVCPACKGTRYHHETLEVAVNGKNIHDVLELSIEEGLAFFAGEAPIKRRLQVLNDLGLGYLKIGHPSTILSGGEAQRVKLASELGKLKRGNHNLYIFDEPTTGLHFADIERLLACLNRLVDHGHSVLVIEHNLDVIKTADHIIDLGPEGGHKGGELLASGTPEEVSKVKRSHTGRYLKALLTLVLLCVLAIPARANGLIFQDKVYRFQLLRMLGYAPAGAAEAGEVLATAQRVRENDDASWFAEWSALARHVESLAHELDAAGDRAGARGAYWRASNYWRAAEFYAHARPRDPAVLAAWAHSVDCFRAGARLATSPIRSVRIPYQGTTLPGYLALADGSGARRPLLIAQSGFDGTAEEVYWHIAHDAVARGYNVLIFEGPGQGGALRAQGLTFRPDWERVVTPVVDFALAQPEVDPARIALLGLSFGGYLAPRAAAFEHRIRALIANGGIMSFHDAVTRHLGPDADRKLADPKAAAAIEAGIRKGMAVSPGLRWAMNDGMYKLGASSPVDFLRKTKPYDLTGVAGKIRCPTLVVDSEDDHESPGESRRVYDALRGPKDWLLFTKADAAGEHCQVGAGQVSNARMFLWLDRVLGIRRR